MFHYYTEFGAKWVELVQLMDKFVPLSRIGIFRNERTRSTPLDPELNYWFVFILFGCILDLFRHSTKLGAKWVELVQLMKKFVPRNRIRDFRNGRTRSTPLDPELKYWFVSYYLGEFWICFITARNSVQNRLN